MNIDTEYIKTMRLKCWDEYFNLFETIEYIKNNGREEDKIRLVSLVSQLSKLAEKSKHYDSIYAILYDPLYPIYP
jgi:hypothetical protein